MKNLLTKSPLGLLAAITLPGYVLDQATKAWVVATIPANSLPRPVIDGFFFLCHWHNTGAAFSVGTGNNGFFIALSAVTFIALMYFLWKGVFGDRLSRIGVALLAAGILGNLTDRLRFGHVVDFLLFYLRVPFTNIFIPHADPWPAFNIADSCICIAVGMFLAAAFFDKRKPAPAPSAPTQS